jgi:alanine-synthesizing transaminase
LVDLARTHGLLLLADEIYDQILYDDVEHHALAALAPDVLCVTFNGLSKSYRVAGYRAGWAVVSGPREHARSFLEGLTLLANMRLCPNVPAQHGIQAALGGPRDIASLVLPGGRLHEQRDHAHRLLNAMPGVSCTLPKGALYVFPRLDPAVYPIVDDEAFVVDFLHQEHVMIGHGTGFNWPTPDHLRIVTLPTVDDLTDALGRLARHLERLRTA